METKKTAEEILSKHLNDDVSRNGITLSCCTEYILDAMEEYAKQFQPHSPAIVELGADEEKELQKIEFRRICTVASSIDSAADECFKFSSQLLTQQKQEAEKDAVEFGQFLQESCSDVDYSDTLASPKPDTEIGKLYFHEEGKIVTIKYMYQLYLLNKQKQK